MSFLLNALGAGMPLLRYGGGHLLSKASGWLGKGLDWAITRLGGSTDTGIGKTAKDWFMRKMDQSFDGTMDYADSYLMKHKVPIAVRTPADMAGAIKDRVSGGGGGVQLSDDIMDGIERG